MACPVYKYKIKLSGKEKQELRQAKKKGRQNARLVIRILFILLADAGKTLVQTGSVPKIRREFQASIPSG